MVFTSRPPCAWLGLTAGFFLTFTLALPLTASAQYFGQNKVQYDDFDFRVIETPNFDIYYYPSEAEAAQHVARMAERWRERLTALLGHQLSGRQAVVLYGSHPEFEQTNVIEGMIDESTGGVTEGLRRRVVLPLAATLGETDHVLGHELVHAYQYDILGRNAGSVPLWFIEGMAEYLSLGPRHPQTAMWLRDAVLQDSLPAIKDLDSPRYFPYRFGHAFWSYIGGRFGDRTVGLILGSVGTPAGGAMSPIGVIEAATEMTADDLTADWHRSIRNTYNLEPVVTRDGEQRTEAARTGAGARAAGRNGEAAETGEVVIGRQTVGGSLNVGPSISPDGSRIAFLSERSRLSIDLYVADTKTGRVTHTLTKTAVDPHFQSLQFLQSAGAWSPDGRQLAVATVRNGKGSIAIFDVEDEDVVREIPLGQRGEVFQPTWSPDATKLVYAAQIGGITDLYLHDLTTRTTRQLTDDAYADLQPAWSPKGDQIVFVSDRVTSNLDTLTFGAYRLATIDPVSGRITTLETGLAGNAVSPQWGPNGETLYFINDESGRPEVYRSAANGTRPELVTAAVTGVSGITPLSPALSMARSAERGAMSVFHDSGYEIQFLEADALRATVQPPGRAGIDLALLSDQNDRVSVVAQELRRSGGRDEGTFETKPYKPRLSLLAVGQELGASTGGAYGTYVSGGVGMLFSDVLGHHTVSTTVDVNGAVKEFGTEVSYINRSRRWNWGVFGERVPLLSGSVYASTGVLDGRPVYVETTDLFRQTYSSAGAVLAYPFSRALRFEVSGSVNHIGFGREVETRAFDFATGNLLLRETEDLDTDPALTLWEAAAALVRDTTAFGATGPILGQRFRFEVAPTGGDLEFVNATADVRQYFMPVRPLTLAGRLVHTGRYGGGSEDQRLMPLFLGYPSFVRGYDVNSFEAEECGITTDGSCPAFDRLIGSRLAVVNLEARMPLFGFGGNLNYGPVPVELFGFFDAGVAWTRTSNPSFPSLSTGERDWVRSAGVGARVNALGYAILELNMARPLDRPERGWMFVFNLRPGF
jgi:hypothetical protein